MQWLVGEVTVAGGWFDYRQKYLGDADAMIVPAALPPDVTAEVDLRETPGLRDVSGTVRRFWATGVDGVVR